MQARYNIAPPLDPDIMDRRIWTIIIKIHNLRFSLLTTRLAVMIISSVDIGIVK
jgi:hypothetical protein